MAKQQDRRAAEHARHAKLADAVAIGKELAGQALRRRAAVRRARRAAPVPAARRRTRAAGPPAIPAATLRALAAPPATGILIAEGDSWFDYPLHDVLSMLADEHGYDVESVAHKGDRVEDMAFAAGQFDDFARLLEKMLGQGRVPDAILLSGGGNDIAGDEFGMLLNHALSTLPPVNDDVARGVIDVRLRNAYTSLISGVTAIAEQHLKRPIPIVLHGYAHAVPDGRGFLGGFSVLPGPWLQPGLLQKGHQDLAANKVIVRTLIDRFNTMLQQVSRMTGFEHVTYVDLRPALRDDGRYKEDWANELHPTKDGFREVAARIAAAI